MNNQDFSKVKVGDRVYSLLWGWGEVTETCGKYFRCHHDRGSYCNYNYDGRTSTSDKNPTLFWGIPEIVAPPKPKKKVTVEERFEIKPTEEFRVYDPLGYGRIIHRGPATIHITYEVEE